MREHGGLLGPRPAEDSTSLGHSTIPDVKLTDELAADLEFVATAFYIDAAWSALLTGEELAPRRRPNGASACPVADHPRSDVSGPLPCASGQRPQYRMV